MGLMGWFILASVIALYKDFCVYTRLEHPRVKIWCGTADGERFETDGIERDMRKKVLRLPGAKEIPYNKPVDGLFFNNRIVVPKSAKLNDTPPLCYGQEVFVQIDDQTTFNIFTHFKKPQIIFWPFIAPLKAIVFLCDGLPIED